MWPSTHKTLGENLPRQRTQDTVRSLLAPSNWRQDMVLPSTGMKKYSSSSSFGYKGTNTQQKEAEEQPLLEIAFTQHNLSDELFGVDSSKVKTSFKNQGRWQKMLTASSWPLLLPWLLDSLAGKPISISSVGCHSLFKYDFWPFRGFNESRWNWHQVPATLFITNKKTTEFGQKNQSRCAKKPRYRYLYYSLLCHDMPGKIQWEKIAEGLPHTISILETVHGHHYRPAACTSVRSNTKFNFSKG